MSLVNFEEITQDLNEQEMLYLNDITKYLEKLLSDRKFPTKQTDIIEQINYLLFSDHGVDSIRITTVRLRKYFNYMRTNGILPIIATSDGCYISHDRTHIEKQILSLEQRARQILRASEGMKRFLS